MVYLMLASSLSYRRDSASSLQSEVVELGGADARISIPRHVSVMARTTKRWPAGLCAAGAARASRSWPSTRQTRVPNAFSR